MPLPSSKEFITDVEVLAADITAITAATAALPATPLEADLPDIVQIVADLTTAAESLRVVVASILTILSTARVNQ